MSHCKCQRWRGEVRLAVWGGDNASTSYISPYFFVSSMISNLQYVSPPAVSEALYACFFDCHQHLALRPGFTPQYACRSTCLRTHTHPHLTSSSTPPSLSYIHAHKTQLPLYACFKEITEASKKRERALANGFIYVPVPQLSNISITHSERRTRVIQEMFRGLQPYKSASVKWACILNHTYISHLFK